MLSNSYNTGIYSVITRPNLTYSWLCKMSLQATFVAITGLETMLLNSVATVEGSTLVT